jgi:hypothetical protein
MRRRFIPNSGSQPEPASGPSSKIREWGWSNSARKAATAARAAVKTGNMNPATPRLKNQKSPANPSPGKVHGSGPHVAVKLDSKNWKIDPISGQAHISASKNPQSGGAYYIGSLKTLKQLSLGR